MKKYSKKYIDYLDRKSRKRKRRVGRKHYSNSFIKNIPKHDNWIFEKKDYSVFPPEDSRIKTNVKGVINFIYELKSYLKITQHVQSITLRLEKVKHIDIGCICLILSVVEEYSLKGILFKGTEPEDKEAYSVFIKSGFLKHMTNIYSTSKEYLESENIILKRGQDVIESEKTGQLIKSAVEKITGVKGHYKPVYTMLGEININSFEHAYKKSRDRHWLLAVYYDEIDNKIIFAFADNGKGILNTLKRNYSTKFFEKLSLKNNIDILKGAFNRKYGSRYDEQENRNRGLPSLRKRQERNLINNLTVISNDVFLNLQANESFTLPKNYSGTFYYWELDEKCLNL